jgi:aminobutyraldehyde dehydrogenase
MSAPHPTSPGGPGDGQRGTGTTRLAAPGNRQRQAGQSGTRVRNFVGGEWLDAVDGAVMTVLNPATGDVIAEAPRGTRADVDRAVKAAAKALPGWLETTPRERAGMLLRLADALEDQAGELLAMESLNVGKPRSVGEPEIPFTADNLRFFAGAARVPDGTATGEYLRGYTSMIRREPVGVVGLIAPWNYPLMMAAWKLGPALAAGNVCVLKPAEQTPLTTLRLAELAQDVFPPGVLNVITGEGDPAGVAMVDHPGIAMVSLTGDVATGKEVARAAARTLKRVHLELGGKAPVLVLADADLAEVAAAVKIAGFWNAGQECAAACRVLAADAIYEQLVAELAAQVESISVGNPAEDPGLDMGPVISAEQQARVLGFLERVGPTRGQVLTGGTPGDGPGFFVHPALVADVEQADEIVQREVFGPVVTVQRCSSEAEALAWANDVSYGLCASVWTQNVGRALSLARRLQFGTVWINDHLPLVSEMPWTGMKQSGYGRDMSRYALEDYTQLKHVMAKLG